MQFLPTTKQELKELGWKQPDIILVSGDTYIDSPFIGIAVIGRVLQDAGYKVAIIAQPDITSAADISRLGEPRLFWGVSGGSVDSMVANYTALNKRRKSDDYTPGAINNRRPDRAVIAYTNLIKRYFKSTKPIVLGGIEASLRRLSHYDCWSNKIRKSILFDAKADILVYGMAEKTMLQLTRALASNTDYTKIPGLCYASTSRPQGFIELPSHSQVAKDKESFSSMFHTCYQNNDPLTAKGLAQKQDGRYLIHNHPQPCLSQSELDKTYELNFNRKVHPYYEKHGKVRAQDTIQFAITTHRGCYGECNFCAIAVHQGRTVHSRSADSIVREAKSFIQHPDFKGNISDVGGPTANMYAFECDKKLSQGVCSHKRCLTPKICKNLHINHKAQLSLLSRLSKITGIKKVFIASGIRYDMVLADQQHGKTYLKEVIFKHVSGQMKIAPEHSDPLVLEKMGKQTIDQLTSYKDLFDRLCSKAGKKQFLTYYLIAAHPGCREEHMHKLKTFCHEKLNTMPQQVQIFTPTPSTYSTLMYWTGLDPFTGKSVFVERDKRRKERQKMIITAKGKRKKRERH